jgi:hypothetical protein
MRYRADACTNRPILARHIVDRQSVARYEMIQSISRPRA